MRNVSDKFFPFNTTLLQQIIGLAFIQQGDLKSILQLLNYSNHQVPLILSPKGKNGAWEDVRVLFRRMHVVCAALQLLQIFLSWLKISADLPL